MNYTGLLGIVGFLALAFLFSENKKKVSVSIIIWGLGLQFLLATLILQSNWFSKAILAFFLYLIYFYNIKDIFFKNKNLTYQIFASLFSYLLLSGIFIFLDTWNISFILYNVLWVSIFIYWILKLVSKKQYHLGWIFGACLMILFTAVSYTRNITGIDIIKGISTGLDTFISFNKEGAKFIFGSLMDTSHIGFIFALSIFSSSLFFATVIRIFDHLGITKVVIVCVSKFMQWHMKLLHVTPISGIEAFISTANIFLSMQSAPLAVQSYLPKLTKSEIATMMVAGLATIAGGTMAVFISLGIPSEYLIAASVMSTPAAIVLAKILIPETEKPFAKELNQDEIVMEKNTLNIMDAIGQGIQTGIKAGVLISCNVAFFISFIALINYLFGIADKFIDGKWLSSLFPQIFTGVLTDHGYIGIIPDSLTSLFRIVCYPFAYILGVAKEELSYVSELLSLKITINEAVAYTRLLEFMKDGVLSSRSIMIASYALCGFANFSSLGIMLGVLTAVAPEKKKYFTEFGIKSVFFGAFASWMTAAFVSVLV